MLPIEVYRHICNVLDVDIDQAFRVAYGEEKIYLPYGVSEDDVMYQLDNITSEELRGGENYKILKLLLVVIFIVASFAYSTECNYIFRDYPEITKTKYNYLQKVQIPLWNKLHPEQAGINSAKLADFMLCLDDKEPLGSYRSKEALAAENEGNLFQIVVGVVTSIKTAAAVILFVVGFVKYKFGTQAAEKVQAIVVQATETKSSTGKTPARGRALVSSPASTAIVPYSPRAAARTPARGRALVSSPAQTAIVQFSPGAATGTPARRRSKSRNVKGGELELVVKQLNDAFAMMKLSAGSSCNMIETTATLFVMILVIFGMVLFAWENVLTLSSVESMVSHVRFFLAELDDVMFRRWEHSWGFVGDILRKVGTIIDTVSTYVFQYIINLSKSEFANVSFELLGIGKVPDWAKGIFTVFATGFATKNIQLIGYNIIEIVLKAMYRIITTSGSAIWATSQQFCIDFKDSVRGSSVKVPLVAVIKEIKEVISVSPKAPKRTEIEKVGKEVKSAVKKVKTMPTSPTKKPSQKRPTSRKKTLT
jgi:hypothetical protein